MLLSDFRQIPAALVILDDHPAPQKKPFNGLRQHLAAYAKHGRQDVQSLWPTSEQCQVLLLHVVQAEVADSLDLAGPAQVSRVSSFRLAVAPPDAHLHRR